MYLGVLIAGLIVLVISGFLYIGGSHDIKEPVSDENLAPVGGCLSIFVAYCGAGLGAFLILLSGVFWMVGWR